MSKREDYKRFIVFCLASLIILAQAAVFAYVWYDYYRIRIVEPFWRRGNWVLIAIYALINTMFSRLYGGLKVGYLKRIDVFYSLTLATICTNVVVYFQITLINRWFLEVKPMISMTLVQLLLIIIWIWGSRQRFPASSSRGASSLWMPPSSWGSSESFTTMTSRS